MKRGLVEGMMYAHKVGLDIVRWLEAISTWATGSRSLEFYEKRIMERDPTNQQEGYRRHNDGGGAVKNEKILPSNDFQPILNLRSSSTSGDTLDAPRSSRGSVDSTTAPANLNILMLALQTRGYLDGSDWVEVAGALREASSGEGHGGWVLCASLCEGPRHLFEGMPEHGAGAAGAVPHAAVVCVSRGPWGGRIGDPGADSGDREAQQHQLERGIDNRMSSDYFTTISN